MSLKRKIIFSLSITFSLLFGAVMMVVYLSFKDFRKSEFKERFRQRLEFTIHVISQSKNFEAEAPLFFIEDKDNVLLNEQILIFNQDKEVIYSTIKEGEIHWDSAILKELDQKETVFQVSDSAELYGALRKINGKNYYILTTAKDSNGEKKLEFLRYLLIVCYVVAVLGIGLLSHYFLSKYLKPLEELNSEISEITAHNLNTQIKVRNFNDEIDVLARSFNLMLTKLNDAFESQKSFTSSAAHEIRTPITRMAFQIQNLAEQSSHSPETKQILEQLRRDVYQLSDITSSLLLLAKFDQKNIHEVFEEVRIDETIFQAYTMISKSFPHLKIDFDISDSSVPDADLTVKGVKSLLEIVFLNLLKNVALYSDSKIAQISLRETDFSIYINISSDGKTIDSEARKILFQAFTRGENAHQTIGSGLGLRIVKRILDYHQAEIKYMVSEQNLNVFALVLRKNFVADS